MEDQAQARNYQTRNGMFAANGAGALQQRPAPQTALPGGRESLAINAESPIGIALGRLLTQLEHVGAQTQRLATVLSPVTAPGPMDPPPTEALPAESDMEQILNAITIRLHTIGFGQESILNRLRL